MPTIDHTAFRTIIGASLTTTALLEGAKELYKRQKKKHSNCKLPCSSCTSKSNNSSEAVTEKGSPSIISRDPSRLSYNPFADPRSLRPSTRRRSSYVTAEPGAFDSSGHQDETEYLHARLSRYEISAWLPIAFTAFHEYPLNTWSPHPVSCPPELSSPFHSSLLLLCDRLRCRTPHDLALILMQLAEAFSGSSVDWEDEVGLDRGPCVSVGELFWAPGPRGIGHPERFWRDALAANKRLPQINPAEIMIGAVVERRGYGREGYVEKERRVGRERVDSGAGAGAGYGREGYVYGPGGGVEAGRVENGRVGSERESEVTTESEMERSRERVVKWEN